MNSTTKITFVLSEQDLEAKNRAALKWIQTIKVANPELVKTRHFLLKALCNKQVPYQKYINPLYLPGVEWNFPNGWQASLSLLYDADENLAFANIAQRHQTGGTFDTKDITRRSELVDFIENIKRLPERTREENEKLNQIRLDILKNYLNTYPEKNNEY